MWITLDAKQVWSVKKINLKLGQNHFQFALSILTSDSSLTLVLFILELFVKLLEELKKEIIPKYEMTFAFIY